MEKIQINKRKSKTKSKLKASFTSPFSSSLIHLLYIPALTCYDCEYYKFPFFRSIWKWFCKKNCYAISHHHLNLPPHKFNMAQWHQPKGGAAIKLSSDCLWTQDGVITNRLCNQEMASVLSLSRNKPILGMLI